VWVSAQTGAGIDLLYKALAQHLSGIMQRVRIHLDVHSAHVRSEIYTVGYIHSEKVDDFGAWILEINVTKHYLSKLLQKKGVKLWV
jgi:GTP-binding protein HflX